jgi:chitinase
MRFILPVLTALTLVFQSVPSLGASVTPTPQSTSSDMESGRVVVYYQGYQNQSIANLDASKFTHLVYAFAAIDPKSFELKPHDHFLDAELAFNASEATCDCCAKGKYYELYKLREKYPHLKTMLSAGGAKNSKPFSLMANDAKRIKTFVTSAISLMVDYGFDGLDIDW